MKRGTTVILRAVVICIGVLVLAVCALALPVAISQEIRGDFDYLPILIGLYVPAVPFFIALQQATRLLKKIDENNAFSRDSVRAFSIIKLCAYAISGIFALGMPYIFYVAQQDDAPGMVAIGIVVIGAAVVIGVFSSLMQKLFQHALDIKSENDLTV